MKRVLHFAMLSLVLTGAAQGQEKPKNTLRRDAAPSQATAAPQREAYPEHVSLSVTPEMWFYEQERSRWEDPQTAVRRNAELRASQRANRIASMHWYGMSNSRPAVNATPLFSTYSPTWSSGSFDPYRWRPGWDTSSTVILVR